MPAVQLLSKAIKLSIYNNTACWLAAGTHCQSAHCPTYSALLFERVTELSCVDNAAACVQKEELLKLAVLPRLLSMMEATAADAEAGYAAAGCLACMVQHPKWLDEVTATGATMNKVHSLLLLGVLLQQLLHASFHALCDA